MTPEEKNPQVHHQTVRGARLSLARKEISQASFRAVLAGELSLPDAKRLGRDGGPTPADAREGQERATGIPGRQAPHCLCGCGQRPTSPRSRFVQGHDHRLYGDLKRNLKSDPLLRNQRYNDAQRRYAVERGLVGPQALPKEEQGG